MAAAAVGALVAGLVMTACVPPGTTTTGGTSGSGTIAGGPASTSTTAAGDVTPSSTTPSPASSRPDPGAVTEVTAALATLVVDDAPGVGAPRYDRARFKHWSDLDGNGCDAREDTLIVESITPAQVDPVGCHVVAGDWRSLYDGVETGDPGDLDVDHVVPLEDAWRSGAWRWDDRRREAFANDLARPDALIAVTARTNRSKGDRAPDAWRPPARDSWCRYAAAWVQVKQAWQLTVRTPEKQALADMLAGC